MPLKVQHDEAPSLNLTPMIDVVFQLIVFFMVATKFTELERDIQLNLPEVSQAAAMTAAPKAREIVVLADGRYLLDGQESALEEMTSLLAAAKSEYHGVEVVIRGDATCAFQHVASAMAACQKAGVTELNVSVRVAGASAVRR
ncbi:MAG: biopolymer transporter ExbD [Planctomycetaceae bacterium]|nr:biopolymer transporter ExbD [Planctomycetaceae bacterium]